MLIVEHYSIEIKPDGVREVVARSPPYCPVCGYLMSGYDKRRRGVIESDGSKTIYSLRRLYCGRCRRLHLEIPASIAPNKHYSAQTIAETVSGKAAHCPAESSTMRRWRKNYPPVLPPAPDEEGL